MVWGIFYDYVLPGGLIVAVPIVLLMFRKCVMALVNWLDEKKIIELTEHEKKMIDRAVENGCNYVEELAKNNKNVYGRVMKPTEKLESGITAVNSILEKSGVSLEKTSRDEVRDLIHAYLPKMRNGN